MTNLKIDHEDALDALRMAEGIIKAYGPRLAGSQACLNAAEHLKNEYQKWCDRVFEINYNQFPAAFFYIPIVVAASYIAGGIFGFIPRLMFLSPAVFALGLIYLTTQFIYMGSAFDRLFKKYPGRNVYGIIQSKTPPKQQVILSGHHDSPHICNFLTNNQKLYGFRLILPVLFSLYFFLNSLVVYFPSHALGAGTLFNRWSGILFFIGLFFIIPLFWLNDRKGSPGASDNLISSIIGIKVAEIIRKRFGSLIHTRIIFLSNDGEEIGLKGARSFILESKGLISECKTYVFNTDCLSRYEDLAFLTSDCNGTIALSARLADEGSAISAELGYAVKKKKFPFGGGATDAAQFSRAGIEATSLIGISTNFIRDGLVYHTAKDTVQNLNPDIIEAVINVALNFILNKEMLSAEQA